MPGRKWESLPDDAYGLFGVFQRAAAAHMATADVWDQFRAAQQLAALRDLQSRGNRYPSLSELDGATARRMVGWDIQAVNTMRFEASSWLRARTALSTLNPGSTPTGQMVYVPPWATTQGVDGVPEVYRFRVKMTITPKGLPNAAIEKWATVFNEGELPPINTLLNSAELQSIVRRYQLGNGLFGTEVNDISITDYELEVV